MGCFGNNSEITVNSQKKITIIWNKMFIKIRQIKNMFNMNKPLVNIDRNKTVKFSD